MPHYNITIIKTVMTIVILFITVFMQFTIDSNYTFMVCNFPVIGYSEESGVQTIEEGMTSTLVVEVFKPAIGVDADVQTLMFKINNSGNTGKCRVGSHSTDML